MDKYWIDQWITAHEKYYRETGKRIWEYAETGLEEQRSASELCRILEENGFAVETGLAGIKTAFSGTYGSGRPIIGIIGEFDALEGLSQEAGCLSERKSEMTENGHGCGHNLLGTGSLAAASAVKEYMEQRGLFGTVKYFGCPGEEKGCGKTRMMQKGCFEDLDAILAWHPSDGCEVEGKSSLADLCVTFHFTGRSAHASSCPHMGRSALDAVELLNVGCNYMREHIVPEARIHYAITDAGGSAPNVIPASASVTYEARAPRLYQAIELRERICKAAEGAALMTETQVEISFGDGYSDYIPNDILNRVVYEKMREIGAPDFSEEEREFAERIRSTFVDGKTSENGQSLKEAPLSTEILPYNGVSGCLPVSTDLGDASYAAPAAEFYMACCAKGTPGHSWQMVSQAGASIGGTGMLAAARVLAMTAAELLENPAIVEAAKAQHRHAVSGGYICPLF